MNARTREDRAVTENDEYAAMLRRLIRRAGVRAGSDPDMLPELLRMADELNQAIAAGVTAARAGGWSWGEIAQRVGTTRQNAQQRWGRTAAGSAGHRQSAIDGQTTIEDHL
jgi:hypothetical protein